MKKRTILFAVLSGTVFIAPGALANTTVASEDFSTSTTASTGVAMNSLDSGLTVSAGERIVLAMDEDTDDDAVMGGDAPNPEPDRSASTTVDDASITAKVKTKLLADSTVGGLKIDVDTRSGVVYLTGGNMKSQAEIDQAVQLAKDTAGVRNVVSKLSVGSMAD